MAEKRTRRLAAIRVADLVGYTSLSAQDEDAALAVVNEPQRVTNTVVEDQGGRG